MTVIRLAFVGAVGLAVVGCLPTQLKPGFCDRAGDCQSGYRCQAQMCVCDSASCNDGGTSGTGGGGNGGGGMGGAGSGGAGDAGQDVAPTCQPSCTAPRSICAPDLTCVECLTSADCTVATKPICDANGTCGACTTDDQCMSKLGANPGVCMAHQDGRCATDAETIYVQNETPICSDTVGAGDAGADAGTHTRPFCSMQPVPIRLMGTRALVVVRGTVGSGSWTFSGPSDTSMIGQQSAFVSSGPIPAFSISNGSIFIRAVKFASSASIGIKATGGSLRLERVMVDGCMGGGILLDGAAFDIRNTTVTNNGPGDDVGTPWGGIRVKNLPSVGPTQLELVTIESNKQIGLTCIAPITGKFVFAMNNAGGVEASPTCNVMPCMPKSATCGAQ